MKRIIALCVVLLVLFPTACFAEDIPVYLNGQKLEFDVPPQIMNDRTMVPMRKIFETLGATVEWVPEARLIFATREATCVLLQIDVPAMAIKNFDTNQEEKVILDTAPVIVDSRTLVPLRAISEAYGLTVEWNDVERAVYITDN